MSPRSLVSRNPEAIATEIDGEVVLMSLITGRTFGLDKRGSRIWGLIEQPRSVADLVSALLQIFDTSAERCEADLKIFLGKLSEAQLVNLVEPKPAA